MIHQLFPIVLWVGGALAQNHCDTFHSVHPEETIWFQSPNFPLNYPPSTDCTYAFEAPEGFVLEFDAAEFSLEQVSPVSGICWDSLTFSELGLPPGSELRCKLKALHCGTAGPSRIRSTVRKVQAVFHTDLTGNAKGFRISVRAIPRPADVCSDDYSLSADVGGTDTVPVTEDENNSADTPSPETVDEEPAAADTEEEPVNMIIEELSPDEVLDLEPMDEVKEEEEDAENGDSQPASATAATDEEPATTNAVTDHFTPEYLSYSIALNAEHDEVLETSDDDASLTGDEPADTSVVPAAPDSSAAALSVGAEGPANAVPEDHSTRQPSQWVSALNAAYGDVLDSEDASPLPEPEDTSVAEAPDSSALVGVVVLDSAAVLSPFSPLDVLMQRLRAKQQWQQSQPPTVPHIRAQPSTHSSTHPPRNLFHLFHQMESGLFLTQYALGDLTQQAEEYALRDPAYPATRRLGDLGDLGSPRGTPVPADPGTVVELQGWKAVNITAQTFTTVSRTNSRECLEACRQVMGCRFVSFDLDTGVCQGFDGMESPLLVRDISHSLLAISSKAFTVKKNVDYIGDDIAVKEPSSVELYLDGLSGGVARLEVASEEMCLQLCRIHPRCNVVTFKTDNNGCFLKSKTVLNSSTIDNHAVSYIS